MNNKRNAELEKQIKVRKEPKVASKRKCGSVQSYFAGANTADGFFNLFDQINDKGADGTLYILKGGPGTGKSTLMKTVGKVFLELGADIEYFYCSSDYKSLDGVRLKDYNIAIVDGTAPHVTEASMPGIKERIINLGEYIRSDIKAHQKEIAALLDKKKLMFNAAYLYLKSASNLYECNRLFFESRIDTTNCKLIAQRIYSDLMLTKKDRLPKQRKLFLKAVADQGTVDLCAQNHFSRIIGLNYNPTTSDKILKEFASLALSSGEDVTTLMDILSIDTVEAVFIPSKNVLVTRETLEISDKCNEYLKCNQQNIATLLKLAAKSISDAKKLHKKIEGYYIPCMDFESISKMTSNLIEEINEAILIKETI